MFNFKAIKHFIKGTAMTFSYLFLSCLDPFGYLNFYFFPFAVLLIEPLATLMKYSIFTKDVFLTGSLSMSYP